MSARRRQFLILALSMIAAQVVVNVPVWSVTGRAVSSHILIAMISAVVTVVLIRAAARSSAAGESLYFRLLLLSFLGTTAEVVIFDLVPFGGPGGSLAGLVGRLILTTALFMITAVFVADIADLSWVLDVLSRLVFRQRLSPGFGVVGGNFRATDIQSAVPSGYPPSEPVRPRPDLRRDPEESQPDGRTGDLARGNAWAEGLLAANSRRRPRRIAPTPVMTVVGFVRRRRGVKLAIINYFTAGSLLRALITMPRRVVFAGEPFPVVSRPWLTVQHGPARHGRVRHDVPDGEGVMPDGHCWVTFGEEGERHGVVTALHVIAEPNPEIGSKVSTDTLRSEITGDLYKKDEIRDAAIIEILEPMPEMAAESHSRVPGLTSVCLCDGRGHKDGLITALNAFARGDARPESPRARPLEPIFMMFNVVGGVGDSGCLVLDTASGGAAPYLIYLHVTQQGREQEGVGIFLGQIASQWKFDTNIRFRPPGDPTDGASREDNLGQGR
jgi:hypothetical protein